MQVSRSGYYSWKHRGKSKREIENLVYTICSIWGIFKKPGLVDEALGELVDLTHDR